MKTGFYQFAPAFGKKEENFNKTSAALRDAELDLIVLPEFFAIGYQFISHEEVAALSEPVPNGPTTDFLIDLSRKKNIYISAGLAEKDGDIYYNSAVLTGPEGFIGSYRKTHLFFEETIYFVPGDSGFRVWDTEIGRLGIMICFDWFFPESIRALALLGAEVVVHPSNLVLPYCPDSMPLRCLENRVFAVTANRIGTEQRKEGKPLTFIGNSEVVSPEGKILVRASEDREDLMTAEIDLSLARDKVLNPYNDLLKDRRPEMYGPMFDKK
ncbi:MAG: acyltransferase [Nitrospira bacterium SG8_35_1]|nr:MAG: acyltransferase [Nitrospira bacterium SG8_35_1]